MTLEELRAKQSQSPKQKMTLEDLRSKQKASLPSPVQEEKPWWEDPAGALMKQWDLGKDIANIPSEIGKAITSTPIKLPTSSNVKASGNHSSTRS